MSTTQWDIIAVCVFAAGLYIGIILGSWLESRGEPAYPDKEKTMLKFIRGFLPWQSRRRRWYVSVTRQTWSYGLAPELPPIVVRGITLGPKSLISVRDE